MGLPKVGKKKAIWENKKDWIQAIEYFKKYRDQEIDLTDCISFSIMERIEISDAFTFDSDFQMRGFETIVD